jgi:hypothetical protein
MRPAQGYDSKQPTRVHILDSRGYSIYLLSAALVALLTINIPATRSFALELLQPRVFYYRNLHFSLAYNVFVMTHLHFSLGRNIVSSVTVHLCSFCGLTCLVNDDKYTPEMHHNFSTSPYGHPFIIITKVFTPPNVLITNLLRLLYLSLPYL